MYEEVLPPGTAEVASALASWPPIDQFYLAGGTALALHLGHRQSRDLDFFTRRADPRLPTLPAEVRERFATFGDVTWELETTEQIQWRIENVSVTLLAYPFPRHFALQSWRSLGLADARDIAIQKAYTLGRRAEARDYLDLHAILTRGILPLDDLLRLTQEIYREAFSPRLFLQQLTYTDDVPERDSAFYRLTNPESFETVTADLAAFVRDWAAKRFDGPPSSPPMADDDGRS